MSGLIRIAILIFMVYLLMSVFSWAFKKALFFAFIFGLGYVVYRLVLGRK